jgi:tetratricopeptide (TPR) repeat protein
MTHSIHDIGRRGVKSWPGFLSVAVMLALVCLGLCPQAAFSADKDKGQQISRVIAKEMTAAQKALQAQQWAEAIKNLEAAETKPGINAFDKKTIYDFKAFAYIKLNNLKAAQQSYEEAIATGAYTPEDQAKTIRILFKVTASTQQNAKAIEYGKQVAESGNASADDLGILAQLYYLQKDCKDSAIWADKAVARHGCGVDRPHSSHQQDQLLEHPVAHRAAG